MKKINIILVIVLIFVVSIFSIFIVYFNIKFNSKDYELTQIKKDNFVIQLINSIYEKNDLFIKKYTKYQLKDFEWREKVTDNFYIIKDSYISNFEYLIYFDNGFILNISVGKIKTNYYGAATFVIDNIYEEGSSEAKNPNLNESQYYRIGKYKIYPK